MIYCHEGFLRLNYIDTEGPAVLEVDSTFWLLLELNTSHIIWRQECYKWHPTEIEEDRASDSS